MKKIAILGLGYVGLPLAVEFAKRRPVVGFDIKTSRIKELTEGHDPTLEVSDENLNAVLVKNTPAKDLDNNLVPRPPSLVPRPSSPVPRPSSPVPRPPSLVPRPPSPVPCPPVPCPSSLVPFQSLVPSPPSLKKTLTNE